MRLSIVATLFRSAEYVAEFHQRVVAAAEQLTDDFELIFVNDGSPDNSVDLAIEISHNDPRVVVIDLARNFGHHRAMMTGLQHAKGERIFLLDSDLEEAPELLLTFWRRFEETRADVVYGVQEQRKGGAWEKHTGALFYTVFNLLSSDKVPPNLLTVRLMSRRYVNALVQYQERELFIGGIWHSLGYVQVPQVVQKGSRAARTYTLRRQVQLLVNAIVSFSNAPLLAILQLGMVVVFFAFGYGAYQAGRQLFWGEAVQGWTSTIIWVTLLGGLNLAALGVIGVYISKIYVETKRRPYAVVRQIHRSGEDGEPRCDPAMDWK